MNVNIYIYNMPVQRTESQRKWKIYKSVSKQTLSNGEVEQKKLFNHEIEDRVALIYDLIWESFSTLFLFLESE